MSKKVDERVVELKFENKQFEKESQRSMSTLDKLKDRLNFKGMSKGVDELSRSLKRCSFDEFSNGVANAQNKFTALQVAAFTVIQDITRKAEYAGKRIISALSVDPIKDGYNEYELMLNTVQTTMRATGESMEYVQDQLQLLDKYADRTIYSTKDMLANLNKFTNSGVPLDKAVTAMIGIANMTADAGQNANAASIAYYNLGQAIGTGYLSKMDYNSINNQSLATIEWKKQMVSAAIELNTIQKIGDDLYKSGKKSYTLQQLFTEGLQTQWATTDVMMKVFEDYGKEETKIGKRAYEAATAVRDFHAMMDNVTATAGTSWKTTWDYIIGNLEEATALWTGLTNSINKIINASSSLRNAIVGGSMHASVIKDLLDKLEKGSFVKSVETVSNKANDIHKTIKKTTRTLEEYQTIVNKVWKGNYKNNPYRKNLLKEAGWNFTAVQSLVDLGYQHKLTNEEIIAAEEKAGIVLKESSKEKNKIQNNELQILDSLSDKQLKELKLTDEEILLYKQLQKEAKKSGMSLDNFIKKYSEAEDGRTLLINSFKNMGSVFGAVFKSIKNAWSEVVNSFTFFDLYKIIDNFEKITYHIKQFATNSKNIEKITNTFKGLFSILKLTTNIVGGGFKIAWTLFKTILESCGMSVLDFTSSLGLTISKIVEFIEKNNYLGKSIVWLGLKISDFIKYIYNIIKKYVDLTDITTRFINQLTKIKNSIADWVKGLKSTDNIGQYIIDGLVNGLVYGSKNLWNVLIKIGTTIIKVFKDVLDIHSPSRKTYYLGKQLIMGFVNGLVNFAGTIYKTIINIGKKIIDILRNINFDIGSIIMASSIITIMVIITTITKKALGFLDVLSNGITSVNGLIEKASKVLQSFSTFLKALSFKVVTESFKSLAIAIAILTGSIFLLTKMDTEKVWEAVKIILVLMSAMSALITAMSFLAKSNEKNYAKMTLSIIGIGIALSLIAKSIKNISEISYISGPAMFAISTMMLGIIASLHILNKNKHVLKKSFWSILAIGIVAKLLSGVIKTLGKTPDEELTKGIKAVSAIELLIFGLLTGLKLLTKGDSKLNWNETGKNLALIGAVFTSMSISVKRLGKMSPEELTKGLISITILVLLIKKLMSIGLMMSKVDMGNTGKTLIGISTAIGIMTFSIAKLGKMDPEKMAKGVIALSALMFMINTLIKSLGKMSVTNLAKVGGTIFGIGVAIGILTLSIGLLSIIKPEKLIAPVLSLSVLMGALCILFKSAKKVIASSKTVIALSTVIATLALSIGLLSIIKPEKLIAPTIALTMLVGIMSLLIKSVSLLNNTKGLIKNILLMSGFITLLSGIILILSKIDPKRAISSTMSLSTLLLTLVASIVIMNKLASSNISNILISILGLTSIVAVMFSIVAALNLMKNTTNADKNANALIKVIMALTAVLAATSIIGLIYAATGGLAALGLVGLIGMIAVMFSIVAALNLMKNTTNADKNAKLLCYLLTTLSDVLIKASIVGPLALLGVHGLAALTAFTLGLGVLSSGVGILLNKFPSLEKFIDIGIPILIKLSSGLGKIIGSFVGGLLGNISNALPILGKNLSEFMKSLIPFIVISSSINDKTLSGIKAITKAILLLTAAQLIKGIASLFTLFTGNSSLSGLGTELSTFAKNMLPFVTIFKSIPTNISESISSITKGLLSLTKSNLFNTLSKFFGGSDNLDDFSSHLPKIAIGLSNFVNNLTGFDDKKIEIVDCASRAITALAKAANSLPKENGLWQILFGQGSLKDFAEDMPTVADGINNFIKKLNGVNKEKLPTVKTACSIIESMADAADSLPKDGGFWQGMFGKKGLASFAKSMPKVADGVNGFVTKLKGVDDKENVSKAAASIIKSIAKLGEINLKNFNKEMPKFDKSITILGKSLKTFINNLNQNEQTSIESAISKSKLLIDAIITMIKKIGSTIKNNKSIVITNFENVMLEAAKAVNSPKVKNEISKKGKSFVQGFANSIKNNSNLAYSAGKFIGAEGLRGTKKAINSNSPSKETYKLGTYFSQGFINAVNKSGTDVYNSTYSVGNIAKKGLNKAVNKITDMLNSDLDTSPTIRPVLDLSDVNSGINAMSSMFNNASVSTIASVNTINKGMNHRNQNGESNSIVNAIDKLRNNINGHSGNTYNINGINYSGDNEIEQAIQTLVRASIIERRV